MCRALVHRSTERAPWPLSTRVRDRRSVDREGLVTSMKSKVHPNYKTKYKVRNWRQTEGLLNSVLKLIRSM